ncbi:NAD(P)-bd-dom domain-containing protein [Fusarium sp. LHS14.1]|nr:NAD(P)-bd-dom domain-containing protein [Fusarium sp. LHS14.1]
MPTIAVVGGTGKLGRAIVDALVQDGNNEVLVVSRQKPSPEKADELGARVVSADYGNVDSLTSLFESNKVDTVISTVSGTASIEPELNLIKAADKSVATKRYIPSIWGVNYTAEVIAYFPLAQTKRDILNALESTTLEHTTVYNGYYLDYWVAPGAKSYFDPMALVIDVANNMAAIPGSGNVPVVFTYSFDIARFVVSLVALPKWAKESYIIGDKITWNEFLGFVEEAKGVQFKVVKDSIDKLKAGQITELPSHEYMYPFFPKPALQGLFATFGRMFEEGVFDLKPANTLNDEFPGIKPRKVRELIFEALHKS